MTGVRIEFELDTGGVESSLDRVLHLVEQPAEMLEGLGKLIEGAVLGRFATGRGPDGIPWPPSERVRREARPGGLRKDGKRGTSKKALNKIGPNRGGQTLVDTGALISSIETFVSGDTVMVGSGKNARGNADRYAAAHQFGVPSRGLPARPYLGFDEELEESLHGAIVDALQAAAEGNS